MGGGGGGGVFFFFFNDTATTEIYTLSLHDALPIHLLPLVRLPVLNSTAPPAMDHLKTTQKICSRKTMKLRNMTLKLVKKLIWKPNAGELNGRLKKLLRDRKSTRLNSSHSSVSRMPSSA